VPESGGVCAVAFGNKIMKNTPQIIEGGGWRGTRAYRIKIEASCALIIANLLAFIAFFYSDTILFHLWIPALISFIVSIILFIREQPTKIELLSGKVGADPRKLYGSYGSKGANPEQQNKAEQDAPSNR
jgi:sugar phosphate permease